MGIWDLFTGGCPIGRSPGSPSGEYQPGVTLREKMS
jgi:hypothetical protein